MAKDNIYEKKITLNQEDQHKNFVWAIKLNFLKKIQQKLPEDMQPVALPQNIYYYTTCKVHHAGYHTAYKDF